MKLTITQLRSIIKEEVANKKLTMARHRRNLKEAGVGYNSSSPRGVNNTRFEIAIKDAMAAYMKKVIAEDPDADMIDYMTNLAEDVFSDVMDNLDSDNSASSSLRYGNRSKV